MRREFLLSRAKNYDSRGLRMNLRPYQEPAAPASTWRPQLTMRPGFFSFYALGSVIFTTLALIIVTACQFVYNSNNPAALVMGMVVYGGGFLLLIRR